MFDFFFLLLLLIFRDLSTSFEWTYIEYIRKVSNSAARVKKKNTNRIRCIFLSLSWLLTFIQKCKKLNMKNIFFEGYIRPSIIDPLLTRKQPCLFIQKKIYSFAGFDISLLLFFLQNGIGCIGAVALQSLPHTSCVYIESSFFFFSSFRAAAGRSCGYPTQSAGSISGGRVCLSQPSIRPSVLIPQWPIIITWAEGRAGTFWPLSFSCRWRAASAFSRDRSAPGIRTLSGSTTTSSPITTKLYGRWSTIPTSLPSELSSNCHSSSIW